MSAAFALPAQTMSAAVFQTKFAETLALHMAAADLLGRLRAKAWAEQKTQKELRLNTLATPKVTFDDNVLGFESVQPTGAIARLRNLTAMTRRAFDGLAMRYRRYAFTVSGTTDVRLIEQIQKILADTVEGGGTYQDFERAVRELEGGEGFGALHLETVFQTNVQAAYSAGRFEQMRDPSVVAALPYWKYMTVGDDRVRPNHAAMDGFVARQDDLVWGRWYPPAGFNCRCTVVPILPEEAPADADIPGTQRMPAEPDPGFGGLGGLA